MLFSFFRENGIKYKVYHAAQTLKGYKDSILAYFRYRTTNAIAEGLNSLIQAAKRRARGYRTFEGYSCMIYLVVGKLKLACPKLFTV